MKTFVLSWVKIPGGDDLASLITTKWYITASDEHGAAEKMGYTLLNSDYFKDHYRIFEGEYFLSKSTRDSIWILSEAKEVTAPPPEMQ